MSQEDMAYELNISLPAYSKIERNITDINYSRLLQICKVLNINIVQLLTIESQKNTPKDNLIELLNNLKEHNKEIINLQKKIIQLMDKK